MNDSWINTCVTEYYKWLRDSTLIAKNEQTGWYAIATPFLGLFNDNIEIYAKQHNGRIVLSDDGQTLSNLKLAGSSITQSPKRKEWLDMVLLNYGITLSGDELQTEGTEKDFSQKKHNLLCAISEISDMAMLANKHTVSSIFKEDVRGFFDEQNIIYTPQFIAKGGTGLEFTFDFQIAGKEKELVIKSFNSLNKTNVPAFLFVWGDVKEAREKISGKQLKGLAIINDTEKDVKQEYIGVLESKGADIVMWSCRHQPDMLEKLAA
ncbi:MAG: DUF1828 domain-containing protein [Prevotellaceae bacterium]|jgi:hypothetical protein|nr:DUF1828 domain-containing protein [Prevotellaceae bacterium]